MPMKGSPHSVHPYPPLGREPPFRGGHGPVHPALLEEMRESQFGVGPPRHFPPPHPAAILEDRLTAQHQEIHALLVDNQALAATHVALKQEVEGAHFELQQMEHRASLLHPEKDVQMREMFEKARKLDMDFRAMEGMKAELMQVHGDIKELSHAKEDLTAQVQAMTNDLARISNELKQIPALKTEIDHMKQELQRARSAIEYEKKGYTENHERAQMMEKKIVTLAREREKLRAEKANTEKRTRAAAAVTNAAPAGYNTNYGNMDAAGYAGNPYHMGYNMHPVPAGMENYSQYVPGTGAWGAYDTQRAQGHM